MIFALWMASLPQMQAVAFRYDLRGAQTWAGGLKVQAVSAFRNTFSNVLGSQGGAGIKVTPEVANKCIDYHV